MSWLLLAQKAARHRCFPALLASGGSAAAAAEGRTAFFLKGGTVQGCTVASKGKQW